MRCSTLHGLSNLRPSVRDRAKGVGKGYVVSMGEELLGRLGVSFHELIQRLVILLKYFVEILFGSHLEVAPFPRYPASILRYSPDCVEGVFSELRRHGVLRSSRITPPRNICRNAQETG